MSFTREVINEVVKGYMRSIQIAYLVLQLVITIIVLFITNYIILTYGKPDKYFNVAMNVLAVLTIVIFTSKIIYQFYENNKGN